MQIDIDVREPLEIIAALRLIVTINRSQLNGLRRIGRVVPPLYQAGVRYQREYPGRESWQTIRDIMAKKPGFRVGDCEDLATFLCAQLQDAGEDAQIRLIWFERREGGRLYHVQVTRGDGTVEDPSARLGMKGRA